MKGRYVPDIRGFGRLCEANYARLRQLLPVEELAPGMACQLDLLAGGVFLASIQVTGVDLSRYTQTVLLQQIRSSGPWLNDPRMQVRLYHDARMAEVLSAAGHVRIEAVYDYPNRQMHLPDEKHQINQFLGEWLQYCVRHRRAVL